VVTPFAVANQLNRTVGGIMNSLMQVLSPVFSRQEGRGDESAMRSSYLFTCRIATYAAVLLGGLMILLGEAFIERWMGREYIYVAPLMKLLVVGTIFSSSQIPTVGFMFGTSRHKFYARMNIVHGLLCLGLTSALIGPFGLIGVAAGLVIPTVLIKFFVQPIYACRALRIGLFEFYIQQQVPNVLVVLVYLTAVYLVARPFIMPGYLKIFLIAGGSCVMFVPYILLVGFGQEQRRLIIRSIIPAGIEAA